MSEYLYGDESPIISSVDWCARRIVKVEARKKMLSETLDVYDHLRKFVNRKAETSIAGIAVRGETWAKTRINARLIGYRARLGALRVEVTDRLLERAES